jgi:ornithine cyclodeaminase/alanine dehydrogenase
MVLILNRRDVQDLVGMKEAMSVVEEAFLELYERKAVCPKRLIIEVEKYNGFAYFMSSYLSEKESLALKMVTQYEQNLQRYGLPTITALILLSDPKNGETLAIMDGTYVTALRTGAASGVASKHLARRDSETVGVFGAGAQAKTQVWALHEVLRNVRKVKVYDVLPDKAAHFAHEISAQFGLDAEAVKTSEECVKNSDVLVLATTSKRPVLDGDWVGKGVHINSVGVTGPEGRELDDKTVKKAKIVVDSKESALQETGDMMIPLRNGTILDSDIYAELQEIIGRDKPGRTSNDEITCWKAVGLAIEDAAVAKLVFDKAVTKRLGKQVEL